MRTPSDLEAAAALHIRALDLPEPVREYRFMPPRLSRFDFAWPDKMVALEVEGGIYLKTKEGYSKGHANPKRFIEDCEKYTEAALRGWKVIRVTGQHIDGGQLDDWLCRALGVKPVAMQGMTWD